jgi:hypothetical protein
MIVLQVPGSKAKVTSEISVLLPARTLNSLTSTELIPEPVGEG